MVFKRVLRAFGVGGPSVDTVLTEPSVCPGGQLTGEVRLAGGDGDAEIEHVAVSLQAGVERGDENGVVQLHRAVVSGPLRLAAKEDRAIPFQLPVPWEMPLTEVAGQHLRGMTLGLRTEVAVAKAIDQGDMDPVAVRPLPAQERVLDAFGRLGFHFRSADLEAGRLHGVHQELPIFQEIEFYPPPSHAGRINEVELTFVASPDGMDIVLEADKRGGLLHTGGDSFGRFHVSHDEALSTDWDERISGWLDQIAERRGSAVFGHGHEGHHGGHGIGMGGVVAGAAAGLVGGMVLGEVMDEAGEAIFGEEEEG